MWTSPIGRIPGPATILIAALGLLGSRPSLAQGQTMLGVAPNRIDYTVEAAVDVIKPDSVNCAQGGLDGDAAVYRREQRHYVQWKNGQAVRDWVRQTDGFDHCLSPDADSLLQPYPDGINFTVQEASDVSKSDPADCPGGMTAIYRRESRRYAERRNGQVVRRWLAVVDVFDRCGDS